MGKANYVSNKNKQLSSLFGDSIRSKMVTILLDGKEIKSPFIPENNDLESIAKIIDEFVQSEKFRENVLEKEYEFVKNISDPKKAGEWWDSLFEKIIKENSSISKKSSKILLKFRMLNFLIANRLYYKKFKAIIPDRHDT